MVYYKGHDIYNLNSNTTSIKHHYKECALCLDNTIDGKTVEFYKYNNDKYEHICHCTPDVHTLCFEQVILKSSKCIICGKIIITKNNIDIYKNLIIIISKIFIRYFFVSVIIYTLFIYLLHF